MTVRVLAVLLALGAGLAVVPVTGGQTPTPEQLEALKSLPPGQQKEILEKVTGAPQEEDQRDEDVLAPETVEPAPVRPPYDNVTPRPEDPLIRGQDTVIVDAKLRTEEAALARTRTEREQAELQAMLARILKGNPYKLDPRGILSLPGINPVPLAGLTEEQATVRLASDPALSAFEMTLSLLPLAKIDAEALQPFGYDLFAGVPSTYAPVSDVPLPSEYVVGPGDRFEVQLIGNTKGRYSLVVNRDGRVMFPELGPIAISGMRFDEAKARIESRVNEQMIGTQAVVAMGDLRSIRVFVLGEAERPGSYTVSGLATITNALFASGGIKTIGSLRNIQLKRNGVVVTRLDLYDLLLNGDTSDDARLLPGDVIFVPPVGNTAGVTGAIRRPAVYEFKGDATVSDLARLGGGLTPEADPARATIERIDERRNRIVLDVDLGVSQGRGTRLRSGDLLRIPGARPTVSNAVRLDGAVHRPGTVQYRNGLRLTDVIESIDELKPNADLNYVLIKREEPGTRRVRALSADLSRAWITRGTDADPLLAPRDAVYVFDRESGRQQYVAPIVAELRQQASSAEPAQVVRVGGQVRAPGEYPLEPGMTVSDVLRAGGGLAQQALSQTAELARYEVRDGQTRQTEVIKVDLARVLAGDPTADLRVAPFDILMIKAISEWAEQESVRLEGEVRFPGDYPIQRGETLHSVIRRAGGLTALAYPAGSVFTRELLKERERVQIRELADKFQQDLASLALQSSQGGTQAAAGAAETLALGQSMLKDLKATQPLGRLVIDLDRVLAGEPESGSDVILKDGDRLIIPQKMQEVTVLGEVQNATSFFYDPSLSKDDYVAMAGGTTRRADEGRSYVVRANGGIAASKGNNWFKGAAEMQPGDTIVVPIDAERMRPLPLWTQVTTIIYNMAVAVAAIGSL